MDEIKLAIWISASSGVWLALMVIGFGARVPEYDHCRDEISVLGQRGARFERAVSYGVFLPVGLAGLCVALLVQPFSRGWLHVCASALAFSLGVGYLSAAIAHWEPAVMVSDRLRHPRLRVHWTGALIEYGGGALALAGAAAVLPGPWAVASAAAVVLVTMSVLSIELGVFTSQRGTLQRVTEAVLFGALIGLLFELR